MSVQFIVIVIVKLIDILEDKILELRETCSEL